MLSNLFSYIVQLFIVEPITAELNDRLTKARAPVAVISQVKACVSAALPTLARRVSNNPVEGVSLAADVWLKRVRIEDVVTGAAPSCGPLIESARPYLRQQAAGA